MKKTDSIINNFNEILHGGDYNPEQWLEYPEVIDEDFRLFDLANCNTFSVGIFAWTTYEKEEGIFNFDWLENILNRLEKAGKKVFLATPTGSVPAWMSKKYPEVLRLDEAKIRSPHCNRHNFCWSSPVYREKVTKINSELAKRFGNHKALAAWHISNEYQGECFCEHCMENFRIYLKNKYGTIENLNKAYWANFWNRTYNDWAEITPHHLCLDGLALDWKRFNSWQICDFMKHEATALRQFSNAPVVTNMMGTFEYVNYYRIAEVCDFIADDSYPTWSNFKDYAGVAAETALVHDMHRAMKKRPFILMESTPGSLNWQRYTTLKRPNLHRLEGLLAVGHGADGVLYFQMRKGRGGTEKFHSAIIDHEGSENSRIFKDVQEMGQIYRKIQCVRGSLVEPKVAFIYDWESNDALTLSSGPSNESKKILDTLKQHYRALWELNTPIDVIESTADFSSYKIIVAPMLYMLNSGVAERIKEFVKAGGVWVSTYLSNYVNETNLHYLHGLPGGNLREVFGIWNEEIDGIPEGYEQTIVPTNNDILNLSSEYKIYDYAELVHLEGATKLAQYGNDFYKDYPALTCNNYGSGHAYYQAGRGDLDFLRDFYKKLIERHNVEQLIPTQENIHATLREADGEKYLFIYNISVDSQKVDLGNNKGISLIDGTNISETIELPSFGSDIIKLID